MESKKLYLISFGNSKEYILSDTREGRDAKLYKLEKTLNDFLKERFPQDSFAYYTTPKVTELNPAHYARYASYPPLDSADVEEIEEVLEKEVVNMNFQNKIDSNAPYANVNPAAVGMRGIL